MARKKPRAKLESSAASTRQKDAASLVLDSPRVFLGPCAGSASLPFLTSAGITHILSVGRSPSAKHPHIAYLRLALTDAPFSCPAPVIAAAAPFIDGVGAVGGTVLVHCAAGVSRSPAVLVGYLVLRQEMTLKQALGTVLHARPAVRPNEGFVRQLRKLEREVRGEETVLVDELPMRREERLAMFV